MQLRKLVSNHHDNEINDNIIFWIESYFEELCFFEKANGWDEFWREYKEQPLVNLLATAIARCDSERKISILAEYPIHNNGHYGRSDLFLNYFEKKREYFFEAKYEKGAYETGYIDWLKENEKEFFEIVDAQLKKYCDAEKNSDSKSYAVSLLFHVFTIKSENDFNDYLERVKEFKWEEKQFYSLFVSEHGLNEVHGNFGLHEIVGYIKEIESTYPIE